MPALKLCHFRAVLLFVLYIPVHALVIQQQYVKYNFEYQVVLFLTFPCYSKTPKILRKYIPYLMFCYMVYTRLRVILVAGLRYVPFLLYVALLRVIYRS